MIWSLAINLVYCGELWCALLWSWYLIFPPAAFPSWGWHWLLVVASLYHLHHVTISCSPSASQRLTKLHTLSACSQQPTCKEIFLSRPSSANRALIVVIRSPLYSQCTQTKGRWGIKNKLCYKKQESLQFPRYDSIFIWKENKQPNICEIWCKKRSRKCSLRIYVRQSGLSGDLVTE